MMGKLIDFQARRRLAGPDEPQDQGHYFCTRCRSEAFYLLVNGDVCCVDCHATMNNLRVQAGSSRQSG